MAPLPCPSCARPMGPSNQAVSGHACPGCQGLWLPQAAQDFMGGVVPPMLQPAAAPNPRRCPGCAVDLERKQAGPVQIDVCLQCHGAFLDPGELAALYSLRAERNLEQGVAIGLSNHVAKEGTGWGLFERLMDVVKKLVE